MSQDKPDASAVPVVEDYSVCEVSTEVEWLLFSLQEAENAEEHRSFCARLIRHARHLDDEELSTLAQAVEVGFQRQGKRGRPENVRRQREIIETLTISAKFGVAKTNSGVDARFRIGAAGLSRAEAVRFIAKRFSMDIEAAGAAYDKAKKEKKKIDEEIYRQRRSSQRAEPG